MNVPRKYGLLRVIAVLLKVLAFVALAVGIIAAIAALAGVGALRDLMSALAPLAGANAAPIWVSLVLAGSAFITGAVWFVQLYAFGSILSLLIDIEENTRALVARPSA